MAMDAAQDHLGTPKLISPENFVHPACDNLSVMTYIAAIRNSVETSQEMTQFRGASERTVTPLDMALEAALQIPMDKAILPPAPVS